MQYKDEKKVKIKMFGSFSMFINGQSVTNDKWKSQKALTIFKNLVAKNGEKLQKDMLVEILWPDNNKEQIHNLHTTIYFLRQILRSFLKDENIKLIMYSKGQYWFEKKEWCWVDIDEFKNLYQKALRAQEKTGEMQKARELFQQAISLYQGDFLLDDIYEDWALSIRQYYRELYIDIVLRLSSILIEVEEDYKATVEICQQALNIDPYREELYRMMISSMIKGKMYVEATRKYQKYARMLHEEFGLNPSPYLKDMVFEMDNIPLKEIKRLKNYFNEGDTIGSFVCDRKTFELIYDLQIRRQKRTAESFTIMRINNKEMCTDNQKMILIYLQKLLREGDVICKWNKNVYLILIFQAGKKVAKKIRKRFQGVLKEYNLDTTIIEHRDESSGNIYHHLSELIV